MQPEKMLRNIVNIKSKWLNIELTYRSESPRQVTTFEKDSVLKQTTLSAISNFDCNIYQSQSKITGT